MSEHCVLVAELARARIFTLESAEAPEVEASPYLRERETLVNPQHKAADGDRWTDTRRGAHREHQAAQNGGRTTGIPHHNFDEHRENNELQHNRRFVKDVLSRLDQVISRHGSQHVILCAEKQVLSLVRQGLDGHVPPGVKLDVLGKDLTNISHHKLHQRLASEGLLPEQRRPPVYGQR